MSVQIFYTDDDGQYDFSSQVSIGSNYAVGGELNQSRLWGQQEIPDGNRLSQIWKGYAISESVSDENGNLTKGINTSHSYGEPMDASRGLTIVFDAVNGIFPKSIEVALYSDRDQTPQGLILRNTYKPTSPILHCPELATNTPVLAISIHATTTNMPHVRLRIGSIYFGVIDVWDDDNIISCKIVESYDPLSMAIMQDVCDIEVMLDKKIEYKKDKRMRAEVYHNGNLQGVFFVTELKNLGGNKYSLTCSDVSSVLDSMQFQGDLYTGKNAGEIIKEIMSLSKIQYTIDGGLASKTVTGLINPSSCREALTQVLFAIGGVLFTSRTAKAEIIPVSLNPDATSAGIVFMGDSTEDKKSPSSLEITAYEYTQDENASSISYKSGQYGKDKKGIFVPFETASYKPTDSYNVAKIDKITPFYAIIDGTASFLYQDEQGNQYRSTDWRFLTKPYKTSEFIFTASGSSFGENQTISGYTLISKDIAQAVADRCFAWLSKEKELHATIAGDFRAGDCITVESTNGNVTGIITEARYSLQTAKKVEEVTVVCL